MTTKHSPRFKVLSKSEERKLLNGDQNLKRVIAYLTPLIDDLLLESGLKLEDQYLLKESVIEEVPRLVERFLQTRKMWKFSVFVAWHTLNRIKRAKRLASFQ